MPLAHPLPSPRGRRADPRRVPDAFTLDVETLISPQCNTALRVLYVRAAIVYPNGEPEAFAGSPISSIGPMFMALYTTNHHRRQETEAPVLLANVATLV